MNKLTRLALGAVATLAIVAAIGVIWVPKAVAQIRAALVKNVDEPGRSPYQVYLHAYVAPSSPCGYNFCDFELPAVPAGKRLVITNVALRAAVSESGVTLGAPRLSVWDSATSQYISSVSLPYVAPYPPDNLMSGSRLYVYNQPVLFYVEAGKTAALMIYTSQGNLSQSTEHNCQIDGYLVDLSQ